MARVLSQSEIDVLLTAMGDGEAPLIDPEQAAPYDEAKVDGVYDFRRPERLSKAQRNVLESIHQGFARNAAAFLSSKLVMLAEMAIIGVEQTTYAEFITSMPVPYCTYAFMLRGREGEEAILSFRPDLPFFIVDRVFGGQGKTEEGVREITTIEQSVMNKIVNAFLEDLGDAWQDICPLSPSMTSFHTNPNMAQVASDDDLMFTISLEINIRDFSTGMSICLPVIFLEEVLPSQRPGPQANQRMNERDQKMMKDTLHEVYLPILVRLGQAQMSFRDLTNLRPGDIVRLDQTMQDEAAVLVGNKVKFYGLPGIVGGRKGVQIVRSASSEAKPILSEEQQG